MQNSTHLTPYPHISDIFDIFPYPSPLFFFLKIAGIKKGKNNTHNTTIAFMILFCDVVYFPLNHADISFILSTEIFLFLPLFSHFTSRSISLTSNIFRFEFTPFLRAFYHS